MSRVGIIVCILASILVVLWISYPWNHHEYARVDTFKLALSKQASSSPSYILSDTKLNFSFPEGTPFIKLVVNANVKDNNYTVDKVNFAIRYEILDSSNNVLDKNDYYFRGGISVFSKDYNGHPRLYSTSFYMDESLVPTDGSIVILSLENLDSATKIKISMLNKDPIVEDLAVRVYLPNKVSENKLSYLWGRVKEKEKILLSKASIYPYQLLSDEEKANLLRQNWMPIGPQGIEGLQYSMRKIYTLHENVGEIVNYPLLPTGIIVTPGTYGMLPLLNGGKVKLVSNEFGSFVKEAIPIKITIYGRGVSEMSERNYVVDQDNRIIEDNFNRGLLQIQADDYLSIRAYEYDPAQKKDIEITPEPTYLQTFQLGQKSIFFEIAHEDGQPSPFQFEFRYIIPQGGKVPANPQIANYQIFDENNKIITKGAFYLAFVPSQFDTFTDVKIKDTLSDPVKQFFLFPKEAKKIEISCKNNNILINAGNRPNELIRKIRIPEDSFLYDISKEWQASWFYLAPTNYKELISNYLGRLIRIQPHPPQYDPNIFLGNYDWTELRPNGNYLAEWLLVPSMGMFSYREDALPTYFLQFPANQTINADFRKMIGMRYAEPSLLWLKDNNNQGDLKIFLDNKLNYQNFIATKNGAVTLPPVPAKVSQLKVEGPKQTRFYINYINPKTANYIKRTINILNKSGLTFNYNRTLKNAATMIGYYFSPYQKNNTRTLLHVKFIPTNKTGIGPWDEWTFLEYYLDIKMDKNENNPIFSSTSDVDAGQVFFMPIGPDLQLGNYEINVNLVNKPLGYLGLSSIIPGLFQTTTIRFENEVGYEQ